MWRTEKHVVKQIYKPFKLVRCLLPVVIHCIIHQKIFCIKNLNLFCIIEPVVSIVNFIYSARLSQWVLYTFFSKKQYPDLSYDTEVWWIISSKILLRYFELNIKIGMFLNEKFHLQLLLLNTVCVEICSCSCYLNTWIIPSILHVAKNLKCLQSAHLQKKTCCPHHKHWTDHQLGLIVKHLPL